MTADIAIKSSGQVGKKNNDSYVVEGNYTVNAKTNVGVMVTPVNCGKTTVADDNLPLSHVTFSCLWVQ